MTQRVIVGVHPVHAQNAEQRQMDANLWTKLTDLTWATGPPAASYETKSIIAICYYSARKLILILPSHRRLSRPRWLKNDQKQFSSEQPSKMLQSVYSPKRLQSMYNNAQCVTNFLWTVLIHEPFWTCRWAILDVAMGHLSGATLDMSKIKCHFGHGLLYNQIPGMVICKPL